MKNTTIQKKTTKLSKNKIWKALVISILLVSMFLMFAVTASAAGTDGDLDSSMKNFLNILFSVLRFVAVIAMAYGVVQLFMAISSHDASQRLQGIIFLAGGLLIFFVKNILELIGVTF